MELPAFTAKLIDVKPALQSVSVFTIAAACFLAGCDRQDDQQVQFVQVSKDADVPPPPPSTAPAASALPESVLSQSAPTESFKYDTPAGWNKEGPKPMREVSFTIPDGDRKTEVIVTRLPEGAGDFVMNVNRWRRQVGLPEVQSADPKDAQPITIGAETGRLYDFLGPESANPRLRQIVAILNKSGHDWFFKIIGPADLVQSEQPSFTKFLSSVRLGD